MKRTHGRENRDHDKEKCSSLSPEALKASEEGWDQFLKPAVVEELHFGRCKG